MFYSTTEAIMRYVNLYQLLACPRSIPLGFKITHVSRTDSHARWERIRYEFASLAQAFPSSESDDWKLLLVSVMSNKMPDERRKYMEHLTGKTWSTYIFERRTNQAYGCVKDRLEAKGLLEPQGGEFISERNAYDTSTDRDYFVS